MKKQRLSVLKKRGANLAWYKRGVKASVTTTVVHNIVIDPTRGTNCTLYDAQGNSYLDFGFVGTDNFGFGVGVKPIWKSVKKTAPVPLLPEQDIYNTLGIRAKEELLKRTPINGRAVVNAERAGGNANECVQKMLLKHSPDKTTFINFTGAFHGRTLGSLSLMDQRNPSRVNNYPKIFETITLTFPAKTADNPKPDEKLIKELNQINLGRLNKTSAVFIELIQGEGGIYVADQKAMRILVSFFRKHRIPIVADEVQSGMGRTGTLWSYEQYDFLPDAVTMGKSLGGGVMDISAAVIARRFNFKERSAHSSTFGFEPAKAAAMLAAFKLIDEKDLCKKALAIGSILKEKLNALKEKSSVVCDVRGTGAMFGIEFRNAKIRDNVIKNSSSMGLLLNPAGFAKENPSIRIMPPLIITRQELLKGLKILERAIKAGH